MSDPLIISGTNARLASSMFDFFGSVETYEEPHWVYYRNNRRLNPKNKKRVKKSVSRKKTKLQKKARRKNR